MGIPETLVGAVAASVAEKGLEILFNELRRKKTDSAWAQKFVLKKEYQNLSDRVETLEKDFQGGLETIKHEFKDLRAELQKNQGKRNEDILSILAYLLKKHDEETSHRFETLEEGFQKSLEGVKNELKDLRAELQKNQGKRNEDILLTLAYLKKNDQKTSHRFETLGKDFKESLQSVKNELKDLRAELKKNQDLEEDYKSLALVCRSGNSMWQLSQRIETLDEDFQEDLETI